jgi:hypothetical protein
MKRSGGYDLDDLLTGLRIAQKAPSPRDGKTHKNAGIRPRGAEKQA